MDALRELADAFGVAHEYWDWRGEHIAVAQETLVAVLAALGVDAADPAAALQRQRDAIRTRVLPPCIVQRAGQERRVDVHVRADAVLDVWVVREDGGCYADLSQLDNVGGVSVAIPTDLPSGYHRLHAYSDGAEVSCPLIVTPAWLGLPARLGANSYWGLAVQLYSVHSARSWGVGDLGDLTALTGWAGTEHGAGFVLVNPLHAAEPVPPMTPSPYLPTTRRFPNPLYLRIEAIPEFAYADATVRATIDQLGAAVRAAQPLDRIDRDASWTAKLAALRLLHAQPRDALRELAYRAYQHREGTPLEDFARWCALTELHGPDWHDWPEPLQHPRSDAVTGFAGTHAEQIEFHRWSQWQLDEQLGQAQCDARRTGLALGIVHDLAVGVSGTGADSWSHQDELAAGITVGAPPDPYAQTGQDWQQPPWRPDRLAALGYAPFRELVRAALRHSGGLRVDHIIGLFRLWWIPAGAAPTAGTYIRYDHDALVGILALEAQRADAVVIGEDLGTVEPWVRDYLRGRGILGTSILWFEFDYTGDGAPLPPERWREYCLASVTTHDLPPTAGYLAGDHVRLRHELGLLTRTFDDELAADRAEQTAWLDELRRRGLLAAGVDVARDPDAVVLALHRALAAAPSRLRCLALTDAVGERRTQNQPGTRDEYPNWRVPLGGPDGAPLLLEDVFRSAGAARLAAALGANSAVLYRIRTQSRSRKN